MKKKRFLILFILFSGSLLWGAEPVKAATSTLVAKTAVWSYYDLGQTPPDDGSSNPWPAIAYDASSWPGSGAAPLGYGDPHITTTVDFGGDGSNKYRTTYFRHTFNISDPATVRQLALNLLRDDGAVVYLNGSEVARSNMPAGAITFDTFASTGVSGGDETTYFSFNIDPSLLVAGSNVLAAEVHQATAGSSDLGFAAELISSDALVSLGATWRYLDDGSNQGTAWQAPAFNDSGWSSGPARLGYGDGEIVTTVSYGGDSSSKHTTTYFRHTFDLTSTDDISFLKFSFIRDDGIVIYLNGQEVIRNNMPGGSIDSQTFATSTVDSAEEDTLIVQSVPENDLLVVGANTLAVEIHQVNLTSSDIGFDLMLEVGALDEFVQGFWSGAITPTSATVNAKLPFDSSSVRLVVSESSDLSNPLFSPFGTADLATNNRLVSLNMTGLTPNTPYFYAIEAEGVVDTNKIGQFTTFADAAFSYTFAMSGDATLGSTHPVYTTIRDQNPLFFLSPGDLFYADIGSNDRDLFRAAYEATMLASTQAQLYQQVPISHMWDDHDYGPNNSDSSATGREASRLTYQEYMPHYPLGAGSGNVPIYQSYAVGRAKFIMTDLRSERDAGANTMMGASQKAWFKQALLDANGIYPLIFWVSSVPWVSSSGSDTWSGFSAERTEIANFIKDNNIEGLVVLSADAHMLALDDGTNSDYATGGGAAMPVFHAAALDRGGSIKGGPYTHGPFTGAGQFALITVTDSGGDQICVDYSGLRRSDADGSLSELIDWGTCFTAVSDATPPQLTAVPDTQTPTTLQLSWNDAPENCDYDIHAATTPYFDPVVGNRIATTDTTSHPVPLALGDPAENHFYKVVAINCNGTTTAVSNHVGEFDFVLVPGSP